MSLDVITFGKAMRDIILQIDESLTERDEKQEKIIVKESHLDVGGGAINTAVSLVKLGFSVAPVAVIANDPEGKEILNRLKRRGVETEFLIKNNDLSTGISVVIEGGQKRHFAYVFPGANKFLDLDMFQWETLHRARFWYILSIGNPDPAILDAIAEHKERSGVRMAFNPGQIQLRQGPKGLKNILMATDILFLNQREASQLTGKEGDEVFKELVGLGPKIVVVTSGKKGAGCYGGEGIIKASVPPRKQVNTLGAGDAFGSGFLAGFMETGKLDQALKWGLINSASVVLKYGAQLGLLTKGELLKRLKAEDLKIEKV